MVLTIGCVHTQNSFEEYSVQAHLSSSYQLELYSGQILPIDTVGHEVYYNIKFDKVKGGDAFLFGLWKVSETDGYKVKRLSIKKNDKELIKLSVSELMVIELDTIDLNEFL